MKAAAAFARRGGQIIIIGEEPEYPPIDSIQIAQRELEIIGSRNGSVQDAADALGLVAARRIRVPIGGRFRLDQLNEALALIRQGQAQGRLVITIKEANAEAARADIRASQSS
jgi:propanol-preferring alcohol dehydrogenase